MKLEFDPAEPSQVESVLRMLKADSPDIWIRIHQNEDKKPIAQLLNLSVRVRNTCTKNGIVNTSDFGKFTRDEFCQLNNCGPTAAEEIETHLGREIWKS